jgi:hypothetical protein
MWPEVVKTRQRASDVELSKKGRSSKLHPDYGV